MIKTSDKKTIGNKKIGITLSGGGIRATIFHLGILKRLAEENSLENIRSISSVSGGSLCIGLIYSHNNLVWPTSEQYLCSVLPSIEKVLVDTDIQLTAITRLICSPWNLGRKVNLLARVLSDKWGIHGNICDLQAEPSWCVNCTTFETGKRFKITPALMGDYKVGYVDHPEFPIADAIAASAGFPILVGPYRLSYTLFDWCESKYEKKNDYKIQGKKIHLWDGGVYDNLGLEALYKMSEGGQLESDIDYLLISNASGDLGYQKRRVGFSGRGLLRLLDVSMDQVASLRMRSTMDMMVRKKNGTIYKIGNDADFILGKSNVHDKDALIRGALTKSQVDRISHYPTTLFKPSLEDYDLLLRQGYEVAKHTNLLVNELEGVTV